MRPVFCCEFLAFKIRIFIKNFHFKMSIIKFVLGDISKKCLHCDKREFRKVANIS